ncbi:hypothetical protein LTR17_000807 [Elasticomyces elasticus]|nr:hypothetical protein LTR17_000807 [Elasticomyces elasticus]
MAFLAHDHPLTQAEVCEWLVNNFGYYRHHAFQTLWAHNKDPVKMHEVQNLHSRLDEVYRVYDSPLRVTEGSLRPGEDVRFGISNAFREECFGPKPPVDNTTFPLFELPPELRITIYEMVFEYPRSGFYYASPYHKQPKLRSQDLNDNGHFEGLWPAEIRSLLRPNSIGTILRPLFISREFYNEAKSIFFEVNNFYFASAFTALKVISRMSATHRSYLKSISITHSYDDNWNEQARLEDLVGIIGDLPGLRRLTVRFNEQHWLKRWPEYKSLGLGSMCFVRALRGLRGLDEATFIDCPIVEGLVKADMLKAVNGL